MTEEKPQIKHFTISMVGDQITSSGNMTLNDVAMALVSISIHSGYNQAKQEDVTKTEND